MPTKFYLVQQDDLTRRFLSMNGYDHTPNHEEADIIVFTGGEDVTPFLYGERPLKETYNNFLRDRDEVLLFKQLDPQKPKVGICRGGQFLNVMSGGRLFQHVTNHAINGTHVMRVMGEDTTLEVTSTHHQMMRVSADAQILACAQLAMAKYADNYEVRYNNLNRKEQWDDVEVAYYWQTNSLCYQPHPEYLTKGNKDNQDYFLSLLEEYFIKDEKKIEELHATKAQRSTKREVL
jgi:GMP synthase-like glutamine amidotransferase